MKKGKILNRNLSDAIASMGHGEYLIISDAGFPIPDEKRIDLAITQDVPGIIEILKLLYSDFIYEEVVVAIEQEKYNPELFKQVEALTDRCEVTTIPHENLINEYPSKAKYIVRTGALEPWGNIVIKSGIDAPRWFDKPGTVVPDYYQQRVDYKEE